MDEVDPGHAQHESVISEGVLEGAEKSCQTRRWPRWRGSCSDVRTIVKRAHELTGADYATMTAMARSLGYGQVSDTYIHDYHVEPFAPIAALAYHGRELAAFQLYCLDTLPTPFADAPLPVLYGGLAFAMRGAAGRGVTRRLGVRCLRHLLGRTWFLRHYVCITLTANPRVYASVKRFHGGLSPYLDGTVSGSVQSFAADYFKTIRRSTLRIDRDLVARTSDSNFQTDRNDITAIARSFLAREDAVNDVFLDRKVIVRRDGRYFLSGRFVVVVGEHRPSDIWLVVGKTSGTEHRRWRKLDPAAMP